MPASIWLSPVEFGLQLAAKCPDQPWSEIEPHAAEAWSLMGSTLSWGEISGIVWATWHRSLDIDSTADGSARPKTESHAPAAG